MKDIADFVWCIKHPIQYWKLAQFERRDRQFFAWSSDHIARLRSGQHITQAEHDAMEQAFVRRIPGLQGRQQANETGLSAAAETLDIAMTLASPLVLEKIQAWDLDNSSLRLVLGYIAGFMDAAYQSSHPSNYDERLVERMYLDAIERNLSAIQGAASYVQLSRSTWKYGGSDIGGLQGMPRFTEGMRAGGTDYINFVNEKRQPLSLYRFLEGEPT